MRFIIECDDPKDIVLGMRSIKSAIKDDDDCCITVFSGGSAWLVKKTKTGWSARTKRRVKDE